MESPGLYFAIVVLALVVALWLAFQIIGVFIKLILLALIVLIGVAAYRAWRGSSPRPG
jgi:hypothetical protein